MAKRVMHFFMQMKTPTVTAQEHKFAKTKSGKMVVYDIPEIKAAKIMIRDRLIPHRPEEPLTGAVGLLVKWCFPITGKHQNGDYKTTKPDTDNLEKMLKDIMTELHFWEDDAQVASEIVEKFWADVPGIYIEVWQL